MLQSFPDVFLYYLHLPVSLHLLEIDCNSIMVTSDEAEVSHCPGQWAPSDALVIIPVSCYKDDSICLIAPELRLMGDQDPLVSIKPLTQLHLTPVTSSGLSIFGLVTNKHLHSSVKTADWHHTGAGFKKKQGIFPKSETPLLVQSSEVGLNTGVGEGSVLGPNFFSCGMTDIDVVSARVQTDLKEFYKIDSFITKIGYAADMMGIIVLPGPQRENSRLPLINSSKASPPSTSLLV